MRSLVIEEPWAEIAYACGFRDYTHFARKFRQQFGCSPGARCGDMVALSTEQAAPTPTLVRHRLTTASRRR
jgi:AraC-like DNA-binding protein